MIIEDLKHKAECYFNRTDRKAILRAMLTDGTTAVVLYRLARLLIETKILSPFGWMLLTLNKYLNGCVIGRNARFEQGFVLMHPVGVIINGGVCGGKNIVIESGVVIGAIRNGEPVEVPKLKNNIFIGTGAKILGGITIGDNVIVGANSVIVKSVPDGATVVGIPGKIIKIDGTRQADS